MTLSSEIKTCCFVVAFLLAASVSLHAEPILPVVVGTLWEYERVEQAGAGAERSAASVQIVGVESIDGKELLNVETRRDNEVTKTELISVENSGVLCYRRDTPSGLRAVDADGLAGRVAQAGLVYGGWHSSPLPGGG
jgi:hypothetical protein